MDSINKYFQRMQKASTLNLLVQLSNNLGLGFAAYYFKIHGVELYKIVLIWAISPLASLPPVVLINKINAKQHLRLGALAYVGMALSLLFFNQYSFLLYGIFTGLTLGLFWPTFNYIFFLKSTSDYHAKDSSLYFIFGPLVGIVLPPLGALIIGGLSYRALFLITALVAMLPIFYIRGKYFDIHLQKSFSEAKKAFHGLRTITFYDGALHYFQGNFLAVYVLLFLKTQYQVGGLLSYLALASLIVSFLLSHVSDRSKKRVEILYPLLITMSVLIIVMPGIKSLAVLLPIVGIYAILDNLNMPIRFAVPMDYVETDIGFWRASEYYGNIGRTVVFGIAALLLYAGSKWAAFSIFAVMTFTYPFIISQKIKILKNNLSVRS